MEGTSDELTVCCVGMSVGLGKVKRRRGIVGSLSSSRCEQESITGFVYASVEYYNGIQYNAVCFFSFSLFDLRF